MHNKTLPAICIFTVLSSCSSNLIYSENVDSTFIESGYMCNITEQVSTIANEKEYTLINFINETVDNEAACKAELFSEKATERHIIVTEVSDSWEYKSLLSFARQGNNFKILPNWLDFQQNKKTLDQASLVSGIEQLPYAFEQVSEMNALDTLFWLKTRHNKADNGQAQLQSYHDGFRYSEENQAGVKIVQCSQNGLQWQDCN